MVLAGGGAGGLEDCCKGRDGGVCFALFLLGLSEEEVSEGRERLRDVLTGSSLTVPRDDLPWTCRRSIRGGGSGDGVGDRGAGWGKPDGGKGVDDHRVSSETSKSVPGDSNRGGGSGACIASVGPATIPPAPPLLKIDEERRLGPLEGPVPAKISVSPWPRGWRVNTLAGSRAGAAMQPSTRMRDEYTHNQQTCRAY